MALNQRWNQKNQSFKKSKGIKKYKNKAVQKVISAEVPLPQGDDFKSFLGISENKIGLQLLLGKALIQNASRDKTHWMYDYHLLTMMYKL